MSCFNVIFTFLPPLAIGIFDQFVTARMLDKYPQMYMLGQANEFFNQKKFWGWFGNAVFHSLVKYIYIYIYIEWREGRISYSFFL
jgi:phospholipid-transporting ATPase